MYSTAEPMLLDTSPPFGRIASTPNGDLPVPYARSAPLFLHDLLDHNLGEEWPEYLSINTDHTPWAKNYTNPDLSDQLVELSGRQRYNTKHVLLQSGAQYGLLEPNVTFHSSCCLHCCHHFFVKVTSAKGEQSPSKCPKKTMSEGLHQFQFVDAYSPAEVESKFSDRYQIITGARYSCDTDCGVSVEVEISKPRIDWHWIEKLTDTNRVRANLQRAKETEPERFSDAQDSWADVGLAQLFTYVKDLVTKKDLKKLTKRNKRFSVVMGTEMYELFRWLGYTDATEELDGVTEDVFAPSLPEPATSITKPGTYRAFLEDIQNELECLMRQRKREIVGLAGRLAIRSLEAMTNCDGYTFIDTKIPLTRPYRFIGAMPNFSTQLLEDTFNRHCISDLLNRDCYIDALHEITRNQANKYGGHGAEFDRKVKAMIKGDMDYLLTTWDLEDLATDDEIIKAFQDAVREKPEQADMSFELLQTFINQARKSARLHRLFEYDMPLQLAWSLLGSYPSESDDVVIGKAQTRAEVVKKETMARALRAVARDRQSVQLLVESKRIKLGMPPPSRPVGLENIGNTCYLNSILQYLYTLVPIQKLVNNYPQLALPESDLDQRLVGASKSKVKLLDLLVSQQFVKELDTLFQELQTVPIGPTQPTQALANTIILSDSQLLKAPGGTVTAPIDLTGDNNFDDALFPNTVNLLTPPLDPVDSGAGGTVNMADVQPLTEVDAANVSLPLDFVSDASTGTLVMDEEFTGEKVATSRAEELKMTPVTAPATKELGDAPALPPQVDREELAKSLQIHHEFSMQQQDVEEIFGRILDRIQAGIAPTGSVYDDIQNDFIMENFFFRMVTYTYKKDEAGREQPAKRDSPEFYRYITAFPAQDGPSTLYDALDRTFDREEIEGPPDMARYTAICDNPPPILNVLIQRTQDNGQKNNNSVILEHDLYLDRYMDAPEGSDLMRKRKESWAVRKRLRVLRQGTYGQMVSSTVPPPPIRNATTLSRTATDAEDEDFTVLAKAVLEKSGSAGLFESFVETETEINSRQECSVLSQPVPTLDAADEERIRNMYQQEEIALVGRDAALFRDMKQHRYRLHAIFCHSGQQSGGHYWVWIRDFKLQVWRKYNDTNVLEKSEILPDLNKGSEPYYLCYVLDDQQEELVSIPERAPREDTIGGNGRTFEELDQEF